MSCKMITAHSGCEDVKSDSIESVMLGIELKTEAVEVDVQIDKNRVLRLSHDEREDYSDAETLESVFSVIAGNDICVNCDLKDPKTLFPVLELADKYNIPKQKLILSGNVELDTLEKHPEVSERARIFMQIARETYQRKNTDFATDEEASGFIIDNAEWIADLFKRLGVECINISYSRVDHELIELFNSFGMPMSLWTVNKPEIQRKFLNENLLNMTTYRPVSALEIRKEIK